MNPATHQRICAEIQERHQRELDKLRAAIKERDARLLAQDTVITESVNSIASLAGECVQLRTKLAALEGQEPVAEVLLINGEKTVDASLSFFDKSPIGTRLYTAAGAAPEWADFVEIACARIKSADDAAADGSYILDSNDCIKVLRGTWGGNFVNDHPVRLAAGAAPVPLTKTQIDDVVYKCRRDGKDTTYDIVAAAIALAAQAIKEMK